MFVVVEEEELASHSFNLVGLRKRVDHLLVGSVCSILFSYPLISQWRLKV